MIPQRPDYETIAVAAKFMRKFGFGGVSIDHFDMFVIDTGMADDPETSDRADARFKAFVADRSRAKKRINRGGAFHDEAPFQVNVLVAGQRYSVIPWAEASVDLAEGLANHVRSSSEREFIKLRRAEHRAEQILMENPRDKGAQETVAMLGYMRRESVQFESKVRALAKQYNTGMNMVQQQVDALLGRYEDTSDDLLLTRDEGE